MKDLQRFNIKVSYLICKSWTKKEMTKGSFYVAATE